MLANNDPSTTINEWEFNPPEEVLQSRLFAAGGYFVVAGLFDEDTLQALRAEADAARSEGQRAIVPDSDGTEGRGGVPARCYRSGAGGELHWGLHGCEQMADTLARVCGAKIIATGGGTYSYYEEEGDFLAVHRDVLQCDVAVITALTHSRVEGSTGELVIYPQFIREPLSTVRSIGRSAGTYVPLDRGQTIILLGGLVPHEVAPTGPGQERIVAINCYRIETAYAIDSDPLPSTTETTQDQTLSA